jgi:hypothetical protein
MADPRQVEAGKAILDQLRGALALIDRINRTPVAPTDRTVSGNLEEELKVRRLTTNDPE